MCRACAPAMQGDSPEVRKLCYVKLASSFSMIYYRLTFAKMTIRTKICCKTYKKIWSCQKKVVPLQRETRNKKIFA